MGFVVLITWSAAVLTGLRLGADDYVVKPFSPLELVPGWMRCFAGPRAAGPMGCCRSAPGAW